MEQKNNAPFLAFTRICLNNWHYISRKILSLNKGSISLPVTQEAESLRLLTHCSWSFMPIQTAAASLTRLLLMTRTVA